jgi:hypothetical protein
MNKGGATQLSSVNGKIFPSETGQASGRYYRPQ